MENSKSLEEMIEEGTIEVVSVAEIPEESTGSDDQGEVNWLGQELHFAY